MHKTIIASSLASILIPFYAAAQQSPDIEVISVSAARTLLSDNNLGSSVSTITEDELNLRPNISVGELLRTIPGISVSRSGVHGSQTQLRMRGGEANQVLVFIDGVKANDIAQGSEFNFAHLLNYDIQSIEVIRGPQSALWGSDALSGVISITTRQASQGFNADVFAEAGSNDWQNAGATMRYGNAKFNGKLSVSTIDTEGENISRQGSENDGYENDTVSMNGQYHISDNFSLNAMLRAVNSKSEFDGSDWATGLPTDTSDYVESEQLYSNLAANWSNFDNRLSSKLSYSYVESDNKNVVEDIFSATGFTTTKAISDSTTLGYQGSYQFNDTYQLTLAVENLDENFKQRGPASIYGDPNRDESVSTDSYIVELQSMLASNVTLLFSGRHDDNSDFGDSTTGRATAAWMLNNNNTKLRASFGTGVKNPTFSERFGYFTNFVGNPNLDPEESTGWEIGIDNAFLSGGLNLSVTYFAEELDNEINGFVLADPMLYTYTAENEDGISERSGIEIEGDWQLTQSVSLGWGYTWLDATEESDSGGQQDEIRRAKHSGNVHLTWVSANELANINVNVDYNGEMDDFFYPPNPPYFERVELDAYTVVSINGSYRFTDNFQAYARVENALDEDYEEVFGYQTPGSNVYVGLRYLFN
ncbi:TonB-dependent receptor plug domain-containing protein [Colwelliaceae bacterium BS250]